MQSKGVQLPTTAGCLEIVPTQHVILDGEIAALSKLAVGAPAMVGWFQKDPNCLAERSTSHSEISQFLRAGAWVAPKSQTDGKLGANRAGEESNRVR